MISKIATILSFAAFSMSSSSVSALNCMGSTIDNALIKTALESNLDQTTPSFTLDSGETVSVSGIYYSINDAGTCGFTITSELTVEDEANDRTYEGAASLTANLVLNLLAGTVCFANIHTANVSFEDGSSLESQYYSTLEENVFHTVDGNTFCVSFASLLP